MCNVLSCFAPASRLDALCNIHSSLASIRIPTPTLHNFVARSGEKRVVNVCNDFWARGNVAASVQSNARHRTSATAALQLTSRRLRLRTTIGSGGDAPGMT